VARAVNYISTTGAGQHLRLGPGYGFSGALENLPQPIGHLKMDNWVPLQEKAIGEIMKVTGGK
jgi:hypothetical protein